MYQPIKSNKLNIMSTFTSNNDHNQVTEANKAPFKLKVVNDPNKIVLRCAVKTFHKPARFDHGDNVTYGKDDMSFDFFDDNGNVENPSTDHNRTVQQPADKSADATEHGATNGKTDKYPLSGELNDGEADVAAASIDVVDQQSVKQPVEHDAKKPAEQGINEAVEKHQGKSDDRTIANANECALASCLDVSGEKIPANDIELVTGASESVSNETNDLDTTDDRSAHKNTGSKTCARPDRIHYNIGGKGLLKPIHFGIEDAEVSEEDSDESDYDLDSEEGERQELVRAVREDIEEKLEAIASLNQQVAAQRNAILKKRLQGKLDSLENEMRLKLASLEDSEATETDSVDEAHQQHTNNGKKTITHNIGNINAASDGKSMAS